MTYRADPSVKINPDAVEEIKKLAKADEKRDFTDILVEVTKKFNLTEAEADKANRQAANELAMELIL